MSGYVIESELRSQMRKATCRVCGCRPENPCKNGAGQDCRRLEWVVREERYFCAYPAYRRIGRDVRPKLAGSPKIDISMLARLDIFKETGRRETHGYQARVWNPSSRTLETKAFQDTKHGNWQKALMAAARWRDERRRELGVKPHKPRYCRVPEEVPNRLKPKARPAHLVKDGLPIIEDSPAPVVAVAAASVAQPEQEVAKNHPLANDWFMNILRAEMSKTSKAKY